MSNHKKNVCELLSRRTLFCSVLDGGVSLVAVKDGEELAVTNKSIKPVTYLYLWYTYSVLTRMSCRQGVWPGRGWLATKFKAQSFQEPLRHYLRQSRLHLESCSGILSLELYRSWKIKDMWKREGSKRVTQVYSLIKLKKAVFGANLCWFLDSCRVLIIVLRKRCLIPRSLLEARRLLVHWKTP